MADPRTPLFQIAANVFDALNFDDVKKTSKDMWELGIFQPPFPNFCIKIKLQFATNLMRSFYNIETGVIQNRKAELMFDYFFDGEALQVFYNMSKDGNNFFDPVNFGINMKDGSPDKKWFDFISKACADLLILLLATKNISKDVQTCNKPNSRNRREKALSKYSSVTTISIGKITETMRSLGSGSPVRPHLRRGHIRHQHYGKGNAEVKKIFIQPMFINADQGWIDGQKEYRVVA